MRKYMFVLLVLMALCLSGCILPLDPKLRYSGEDIHLDAAAIYSMPGVASAISDEILVLEQDTYGRVLYAICLDEDLIILDKNRAYEWKVLAVLVIQKYDDSHVYFYGERNYRMVKVKGDVQLTEELVSCHFDEDTILQLKEENDWDIPADSVNHPMVKTPIQVEKDVRMNREQEEALYDYIGSNLKTCFLRADQEGRQLFFVLEICDGAPVRYQWYVAMFNLDGTLSGGKDGVCPLYELTSINKEIAAFLEAQNWVDII